LNFGVSQGALGFRVWGRPMLFRLSLKLQTKLKITSLSAAPLDPTPYWDWTGHVFTLNRAQYVIVTNTASLYSCMMHGAGLTNDHALITRAMGALRDTMEDDGLSFAFLKFIAPGTESIHFAKALNRSVTGSMNDMIHCGKYMLNEELSPFDVGFRLNDMPMSALKYGKPREAFKALFDGIASPVVEPEGP
jgi:hypothetical protein